MNKRDLIKIITVILIMTVPVFPLRYLIEKDAENNLYGKVIEKTYYLAGWKVRELPHKEGDGEKNMTYSEYYKDAYYITIRKGDENICFNVDYQTYKSYEVGDIYE